MSATHSIGIPGVEIESGDHICALFEGDEQRDAILFSFLQAGIDDGDKCVVVVDRDDPVESLRAFATADAIAAWEARGILEVSGTPADPPAAGGLEIDQMLANWDDAIAATQGPAAFDFVRVTGDATWWSTQADGDTLVHYESALTGYIPERVGVLCLYDVERVERSTLINAVRTHPRLLVGSVVIENPYYLPPDELALACEIPILPGSSIELGVHQLAKLERLDPDLPVFDFECEACGMVLATTVPTPERPTVLVVCPRCRSAWDHGLDGVLTKRRP